MNEAELHVELQHDVLAIRRVGSEWVEIAMGSWQEFCQKNASATETTGTRPHRMLRQRDRENQRDQSESQRSNAKNDASARYHSVDHMTEQCRVPHRVSALFYSATTQEN